MASLRISMELGRKVSMADALIILADVAEAHPEEIRERAAPTDRPASPGAESSE